MKEDNLLSLVFTLTTFVFIYVFLNVSTIENDIEMIPTLSEVTIDVQDIEVVKQEEKIKDFSSGDVKNFSQNLGDKRETNNELAKNSADNTKNDNINSKEEIIIKPTIENKPNEVSVTLLSQQSSEFKYEGNVMVQWKMDGRTPHNNNNWHIRNPGYMCGFDEDGLLYLDVTINDMGDVIEVKINKEKSVNQNSCIVEQGIKYAKMSKFSASNKKQKGYIIYKFVGQ
jgi:hypothetical protein